MTAEWTGEVPFDFIKLAKISAHEDPFKQTE